MKKTYLFGIALTTFVGVAVLSAVTLNSKFGNNISVKAEETEETIEFVRDGSNLKQNANNWTVKSVSASGTEMYACTNTTFDLSTRDNYVCSFTSDTDYLTFSLDDSGSTALKFQYIKTISVTTASLNLRKYNVEVSSNGTAWTNKGVAEFTNSERSTNLAEGAKYVRLSRATTNNTSFVNIKITYKCNPDGDNYPVDPTPDTPDTPSANGTYVNGYYKFIIEDGYAYYIYADEYSLVLSYTLDGENITFTLIDGDDNEDFGSKRLFNGSETVNDTGKLTSTSLKITTYGAFGASTTTFNKQ